MNSSPVGGPNDCRTWMRFECTILLLVALTCSACGLKRPPIPAIPPLPHNRPAIRASVSGGLVRLKISIPSDVAVQLGAIKLLRRGKQQLLSSVLREIPLPPPTKSAGVTIELSDRVSLASGWVYSVLLIHRDGRRYTHSPRVLVDIGSLPERPANLRSIVTNGMVRLQWRVPKGGTVLIYRRKTGGRWGRPLAERPIVRREFVDLSAELDGVYEYRAQIRQTRSGVLVYGPFCKPITVRVVDNLAPYPPVNLKLKRVAGGVILSWDAVRDRLAGYHVYIRRVPAGKWRRLTKKVVSTTNSYVKIQRQSPHELAVTAVDASKRRNESRRSVAIQVSLPPMPKFEPPPEK